MIAIAGVMRFGSLPERPTSAQLAGGAERLSTVDLKAAAADELQRATTAGGAGYTFEIVQRSTLVAKPGGPRINVPDPADYHRVLETVDSHEVDSLIERGVVTPDGFWMEMRTGPTGDAKPDWDAEYKFGALVRDGKTYRNDGEGWYETDQPPGIGLDPRTAALLPTLLRNAGQAKDATTEFAPGAARSLTAMSTTTDLPGIVAVDGEAFTELNEPIELAFDDAGRLISLRAVARNTNVTEVDLMVDTVITFAYPDTPPALPEPSPAFTRTVPITTP